MIYIYIESGCNTTVLYFVVDHWQAYTVVWRGMRSIAWSKVKIWWAARGSRGPLQLTWNVTTGFRNLDCWPVYVAVWQGMRSNLKAKKWWAARGSWGLSQPMWSATAGFKNLMTPVAEREECSMEANPDMLSISTSVLSGDRGC
jgi:hypothetical protein